MNHSTNDNFTTRKKLKELEAELENLKKGFQEEENVARLEDYTILLKYAIMDKNPLMPTLDTFRRYLFKLDSIENITYIMRLFFECWTLVYPNTLFDPQMKSVSSGKILKMLFCKNVRDRTIMKKLLDKRGCFQQAALYFTDKVNKRWQAVAAERQLYFKKYMEELWIIAEELCDKKGVKLEKNLKNFSFALFHDIDISLGKLQDIYKYLVENQYLNKDEKTEDAFLSLFGCTPFSPTDKIAWLRQSRNQEPNYASLYTLFEVLGVDMEKKEGTMNKKTICHYFVTFDGHGINVKQLKKRRQSKELATFSEKIRDILQQP